MRPSQQLSRSLSILFGVLTLASASQEWYPVTNFQQDIIFPGSPGHLSGSLTLDSSPLQLSAGFYLNPPPDFRSALPVLPGFAPHSPQQFLNSPFRNLIQYERKYVETPSKLTVKLFTPSLVEEQAESDQQKKAFADAADQERTDAQNAQNEESNENAGFVEPLQTTAQPAGRSFVNINVQGKEYSYST